MCDPGKKRGLQLSQTTAACSRLIEHAAHQVLLKPVPARARLGDPEVRDRPLRGNLEAERAGPVATERAHPPLLQEGTERL